MKRFKLAVMGNYARLSRIFSVMCNVMLKIWAYSGLVLLLCFLLYYLYGGTVAALLLLFAAAGLYPITSQSKHLYNHSLYPQAFYIMQRTTSFTIQSYQVTQGCSYQCRPCTICPMSKFKLSQLMELK